MTSPSGNFTLEGAVSTVGEGGVASASQGGKGAGTGGNLILSQDKLDLLDRLKEVSRNVHGCHMTVT